MKDALKNMQPVTSGVPHNPPIKIDDDVAISYEVVQDFKHIKTHKNKVDCHVAHKYLTGIDNDKSVTDEMVDPETEKSHAVSLPIILNIFRYLQFYTYANWQVSQCQSKILIKWQSS